MYDTKISRVDIQPCHLGGFARTVGSDPSGQRGSEVLKTIEGASRNHAELMAAAGLGPTEKGTYV